MKRCPKHYWFEYDETQGGCQLCEREALKAGAQPGGGFEMVPPPPEPVVETQPAPAPIFAQSPPLHTSPWPAEDTQPREPRAAPPEPAPAYIASEPIDDEDTRILNQLTKLRNNGVFTVVLVGFYAGGKTWFLNRVKHELGRWGFNLSPPPAQDRERVIRTVNVEVHHARRLKDDQVRGFALVDIPGERLTRLVAKDFRSVRSVIAAMDMCGALIVVLPADEVLLSEDIHREAVSLKGVDQVLCRRTQGHDILHPLAQVARELVVEAGSVENALGQQGLKAAEMDRIRALGEEKSEDERQKLLRLAKEVEALDLLTRVYRLSEADAELAHFTQDLAFLTGLMSKLKRDGVPIDNRYDFGAIDAGDVDVHISSLDYARFKRPTFVAMTKADLVSHPDPLLECLIKHSRKPDIGIAFDEDPLDTVREMRTSLASMFEQWFGTVKFDFVTAFHEHRHTDTINYSTGHFGVTAVFDWISWAQRWDELSRGERAALKRAKAIRHSRDGRIDPAKEWTFMSRAAARSGGSAAVIATSLLPKPWRRALIDSVYGSEDDKGLRIYLGILWGGLLLLSLILLGLTPWSWPAEREGLVASMAPVTCEEVYGEDEERPAAASTNKSRAKTKAGSASARSSCRQILTDGERAQLSRTEELVAYLQRGGVTPPPLAVAPETPLRGWIDSNVCRLGGAGFGDRGALAWHVWQGIGECGPGSRLMAQLPLSILLTPWLGLLLTPLLIGWLAFRLLQHTLRMPSTRRAYRLLYGSEHKAP